MFTMFDLRSDRVRLASWLTQAFARRCRQSTLRSILLPLTQTSPVAYPLQTLIDAAMSGLFVNAGDVQMRTTYSLLAAINVRRKAVTVAVAQSEVHTPPIDQVVVDIVCDLLVPLALLEDVFTDCLGDISNDFYGDLIQAHSPFETARPGQLAPVINHTLLTAAHLRADEELYAQLLLPPGIVTVLLKALLQTMMQADWIPRLIGDGLAVLLVNFAPLSNASDAKGKATETAQQREAENGLATLASLVRRVGQGGELRGPWGDWVRKQVESVICDPVNGVSCARPPCERRRLTLNERQTPRWSHRYWRSARRSRPFFGVRWHCRRQPNPACKTKTNSYAMRARALFKPAWAAAKTSQPK